MGVYIEDMEMPKSCESCPCKTANAFGGLGCQATGYIPLRKANQDRPDNCPLVPVPPHGRLIDADALINMLQELFDRRNEDAKYTGFRGASVSWNDAICYLKDAPTIIEAEEVKK